MDSQHLVFQLHHDKLALCSGLDTRPLHCHSTNVSPVALTSTCPPLTQPAAEGQHGTRALTYESYHRSDCPSKLFPLPRLSIRKINPRVTYRNTAQTSLRNKQARFRTERLHIMFRSFRRKRSTQTEGCRRGERCFCN